MTLELDFRGSNVSGPVVPGRLTRGTVDQLRMARHVVFLIHGFNLDRHEGREAMHNLATNLPSASDAALVSVLWPGDHWSGALSYSFEGRDADDTAMELARYITIALHSSARISFVTHSLGARIALSTIQYISRFGFFADQVCMMAAAVDDFVLSSPYNYKSAVDNSSRVTVLASRRDSVLRYAYPAADLLQSFVFWRSDDYGRALGYHGPKSKGSYQVPREVFHSQIHDGRNAGHSDYVPSQFPSRNQQSAADFCDQVLSGSQFPIHR